MTLMQKFAVVRSPRTEANTVAILFPPLTSLVLAFLCVVTSILTPVFELLRWILRSNL